MASSIAVRAKTVSAADMMNLVLYIDIGVYMWKGCDREGWRERKSE